MYYTYINKIMIRKNSYMTWWYGFENFLSISFLWISIQGFEHFLGNFSLWNKRVLTAVVSYTWADPIMAPPTEDFFSGRMVYRAGVSPPWSMASSILFFLNSIMSGVSIPMGTEVIPLGVTSLQMKSEPYKYSFRQKIHKESKCR